MIETILPTGISLIITVMVFYFLFLITSGWGRKVVVALFVSVALFMLISGNPHGMLWLKKHFSGYKGEVSFSRYPYDCYFYSDVSDMETHEILSVVEKTRYALDEGNDEEARRLMRELKSYNIKVKGGR